MTSERFPSAYEVALGPDHLALLGEIIVIIGQIEDCWALSLTGVLGISRAEADAKLRDKAPENVWKAALKGKHSHPRFNKALERAAQESGAVRTKRNNFVHADYRHAIEWNGQIVTIRGSGPMEPTGRVVATKLRDQSRHEPNDLFALRNEAARASCLVAHVAHVVAPHGDWDGSPWLPKIAGILQVKRPATSTSFVHFDGIRPVRP